MKEDKPKILLVSSTGLTKDQASRLEQEFRETARIVVTTDDRNSIFSNVSGIHALISCPRAVFSEAILFEAGKALCWIHVPGAGCEDFLIKPLIESEIVLTNGKIIQGPSVADHAVALLLCLTRNLNYVLRGKESEMPRPIELRGKTALIIGCGGIGTLIAERLFAFGMKILGVTPEYIPLLKIWDKLYPPHRLEEALPLADVVFVSVPSTEETKKRIGREEFSLMKEGSYFINVSRGTIVDTQALAQALERGKLKGVGLDVTDPEPLPKNHVLKKMDNVVITPHVAGPSDKNRERSFQLIRNNIERFLHGRPLINVVNKQLGY